MDGPREGSPAGFGRYSRSPVARYDAQESFNRDEAAEVEMPYKQKQARAIFLAIKRKKGTKAAKKFGRKHRKSFTNKAKKRKL